MSNRMLLRRLSVLSLLNSSSSSSSSCIRPGLCNSLTSSPRGLCSNATKGWRDEFRNYKWGLKIFGSVNLVLPKEGNPKFEIQTTEPPRKHKHLIRKRIRMRRKREIERRRHANKHDPRRLPVKGTKEPNFERTERRLKEKLKSTKTKEAYLIERLKRYEFPQEQGPVVKPHELTGEERFYLERMGQKNKRANYVPVGRRGIFGGVIQDMHLHWKRHETVKVICKHCKPDKLEEYKNDIVRLSGGFFVQVMGRYTLIFYRGKYYRQPDFLWPIDTMTKRQAYQKSMYEQALASARHVIKLKEKQLELYYRHQALYDVPINHNPDTILEHSTSSTCQKRRKDSSVANVRPQVQWLQT